MVIGTALRALNGSGNGEEERAPMPRRALDPDASSMRLDDTPGDGESLLDHEGLSGLEHGSQEVRQVSIEGHLLECLAQRRLIRVRARDSQPAEHPLLVDDVNGTPVSKVLDDEPGDVRQRFLDNRGTWTARRRPRPGTGVLVRSGVAP
jgi:hypothetical protein